MYFKNFSRAHRRAAGFLFASFAWHNPASAHEAWLLTPDEIATLAQAPIPWLFTSHVVLGLAAFVGCAATGIALHINDRFAPIEARLASVLRAPALLLVPLALRFGLGIMLILAGTGGLPRHGTAMWTTPTLLVPDMQLVLLTGWDWLALAQIVLGVFLILGLGTRWAALVLGGLVALGLILFGVKFLAYAPHFLAPALMLIVTGAGSASADHMIGGDDLFAPTPRLVPTIWRLTQVLVGSCFVYLAVMYKLTQPTLLIAILQHGDFPSFGLPLPVIALIMTGVEIICGALLIAGRAVRPVAAVIIGAITFLAVTLGETPLFHANLYAVLFGFVLVGRDWDDLRANASVLRRVTA